MKNVDRIIAQAREWAAQACAIAEISADLSTVDGVQNAHDQAAVLCMRVEKAYRTARDWMQDGYDVSPALSNIFEANVRGLGARWAQVEGACASLSGLLRLWTAAEGRPVSKFDARHGDGVRRGFLDCAAGLATVFSAPGGFTTCKPAQHAARKGAQELFDTLAREEES